MSLKSGQRIRLRCSQCGATYTYSAESVSSLGHVVCQNCGKTFPLAAYSRLSLDTWAEGPEIE